MNIFLKKLLRGKAFTLLTSLMLAVSIAFFSIGCCAWRGIGAQLERVGEQYTTIAVSSPNSYIHPIFCEDNNLGITIPLTQQKREYPGLLGEDLRGFLTAHVAGCSTLSCYEPGVSGMYLCDFDAYGTAMGVVAAKCVSVQDTPSRAEYTTTLKDGTLLDVNKLSWFYSAEFSVEEMVCRHPAYSSLPEVEKIIFTSQIYTDEKSIPFEAGKTYLLFGVVDGPNSYWEIGHVLYNTEIAHLTVDQTIDNGYALPRTGNMLFYWHKVWIDHEDSGMKEDYSCLDEDSLPFYAEYSGDWKDFLDTEEGRIWRETLIPLCQINHESAAVILTDNVKSLLQFNTGAASLVEGRYFEGAEYANGDNVCLVGSAYALKNGLSVGDTINLDFYDGKLKYRNWGGSEPILIHGPCRPDNRIGVQKDYEIIGIYTAPEFVFGQHSFQGDTIFIPKNSVPNSSLYEDLSRPLLYSAILENGKVEEFENYLASMGYGGMFEYFDQQYNILLDTYTVIAENARRLLALGAAAFVLAAALFEILSLRRMAPAMGGMRLMGVKSGRVWREVTSALAMLALFSAAIGGILGAALYGMVTREVLSDTVELDPPTLAICTLALAAVLAAASALCALPVSRRKLMQARKKRK